MDEFSGIDFISGTESALAELGFAAGTVRGARSFDIDALGRLVGVAYPQVWRPGENAAECRRRRDDYVYAMQGLYESLTFGSGRRPKRPLPPEDGPHAMRDCKHGFYGYYDGSDDYHEPGRVSGVIEGYGETVIGTRGFRCMKARIVALHIPDTVKPGFARMVARNYADVPMFSSFDEMVAAFPPDSAGQEPSPDNDPGFWDRSL